MSRKRRKSRAQRYCGLPPACASCTSAMPPIRLAMSWSRPACHGLPQRVPSHSKYRSRLPQRVPPPEELRHDAMGERGVGTCHELIGQALAAHAVEGEPLVLGGDMPAPVRVGQLRQHVMRRSMDPHGPKLDGHSQRVIRPHSASQPIARLQHHDVAAVLQGARRSQAGHTGADHDDPLTPAQQA
eukprot:scaffold102335_cov63-Phaeocystis_antarctica.AAC.4